MKYLFFVFYLIFLIYPAEAVTTRMFKVLDTCARYRLGEFDANEAIEKLKLSDYQLLWLVFFKGVLITIIFKKFFLILIKLFQE